MDKHMKRFFRTVLSLTLSFMMVCAMAVSAMAAGSGTTQNAVAEAANGVVQIYAEVTYSDGTVGNWTGSAFGIGTIGEETRYFITNRHVVTGENEDGTLTVAQRVYIMMGQNALTVTDRAVEIDGTLYDGDVLGLYELYDINTNRMVECDVVYYSEDYDFAIIKALSDVEGRVALELGNSSESMQVADTVYALGFPAVSDAVTTATGWVDSGNYYDFTYGGYKYSLPIWTYTQSYNSNVSDVTVTTGAISRFTTMTRENSVKIIQHDATLNGGNSGGPLVNENGLVIGVNTYNTDATESLNYAIYIDYVTETLTDLGIEFNVRSEEEPEPTVSVGVIVAVVVIALVTLIVIIVLVIMSRKKKAAGGQSQPQPFVPSGGIPISPTGPATASVKTPGDSGLRFQGESGSFAGRRFPINGIVRIGRDPANQLVYPAEIKGISRNHCELRLVNGEIFLVDLGSSYGTYLGNGQQLAANQPVRLQPGDRFYLGSKEQSFIITRTGGV